ncbi:helix-turn-helix domain-containing protein [Bradyrhizobium sp. RDM4]|uniref:helix-turn-helix domain-containing protein n=1 Tax=Bradyrhizobium sp. RDM4 TaxID=3378765 RepID=UPI0038FC58CE
MGYTSEFVRSVGGDLVSSAITKTRLMRLEVLRRENNGRMHWHFRQPEPALFLFSRGAERLQATVDGRKIDCFFPGESRFAIFPGSTEIVGQWNVGPMVDYTVVFLNPSLVRDRLGAVISEPMIGFGHESLERGLCELTREATCPDDVFEMMAEGWTIQALAYIGRLHKKCSGYRHASTRGGLPGSSLRRLDDFVRTNLSNSIRLDELADIAGLSTRQFLRAFQESIGASPYKYVLALRIAEAKHRLARSADDITEIALATGFSHAQHFSTSFRKATGETPSSFRRRARS